MMPDATYLADDTDWAANCCPQASCAIAGETSRVGQATVAARAEIEVSGCMIEQTMTNTER